MEEYKIEYAINKFFRMVKVRMFQDEKDKIKQKQAIINYGKLLNNILKNEYKTDSEAINTIIKSMEKGIM